MSKKIILRQSVKSGVAVVFFFGLGMASINAQTTQPTGKVGINTTEPTETLDVKGKVRIQELYTDNQQTGTNNATFTATNVVTVDNNGVLGKKLLSDITAAQTPNLPWKKVGTTENAVPAGGLSMYSRYAVGIGEYGASGSKIGSSFEINEGGTTQLGLINTKNNIVTKWHISTEDRALTFTKRKPEEGRIFSLTQDAKLFLGNNLFSEGGSNAKVILDGGNGKIGIGKNSAEYNLDVEGDAKISGLPDKGASDTVKMVVVDDSGVLKKAAIPTGGGSGNGVTKHTTTTPTCNAANAGTIHYKEGVTVNGQPTSVMGFCMKTAGNKYRWFYIFGGAGTTAGSEADAPNFGEGIQ